MSDLDGKIALVTGGNRGIGRGVVEALHGAGATVYLTSRDAVRAEAAAREVGPRAKGLGCDVRREDQVKRAFEIVGRDAGGLDVLVNNAGFLPAAKQIYNVDLEEWQHVIDVNLRGPWFVSKLAHPHMKARGGGAIVNVASTSGLHHDIGLGVYSISKAGVVMLTEVCAKEWARDKIRVNAIAPGIVKTQLAGDIIEYLQTRNMKPNPMNLYGEPEDIARLVRFLVTDESRFMTGSIIRIDGGELL
jgi:NAD(P)-dependent dehydrogenase (short-subunit alcohol dehydrogenase family)